MLLGDGEVAEGGVYEALQVAVYHGQDDLCAIVNVNKLAQSGPTMCSHNTDAYQERFSSFGAQVITVNSHDIHQLISTLSQSRKVKRSPTI